MKDGIDELARLVRAEIAAALDHLATTQGATAASVVYVPTVKAGAYIVVGDTAEEHLMALLAAARVLSKIQAGGVVTPVDGNDEPDASRN